MFSPDYSSSNRFLEEQTDSNLSLKEILQANADIIDYRETQSKTSAIIKFFSGIISILASCALIWMIRRSHLGLSTTYHRLILGLCVSDLIYTSCFPLLNIPVSFRLLSIGSFNVKSAFLCPPIKKFDKPLALELKLHRIYI